MSSRRATTNLPLGTTSFVGRAADVSALAGLLDETPIVTVLGPGGMGKTRLALRVAEECVARYRAQRGGGGIWFCDLTEARDAADIVATVASSIGAKSPPREHRDGAESDLDAATAALARAIAQRGRVLIVLDNFDRLADAARVTVGRWLHAAPSARFLVTSRVPLDLPSEQRWVLDALPRDEAVELFARRARAVLPGFDSANATNTIDEIVDAIDRMPLAIELAASRMAVLSVVQLRDRLTRSRALLAGPGSNDGRHASMQRTVRDSVEVLSPAHRQLFARCAIFRNGFTLDAAEAVLGGVDDGAQTLSDLEMLARHSLLRVEVAPKHGELARYSLFETIRDVAEGMLAEDPSRQRLAERHATHYAALGVRLRAAFEARGVADLVALSGDLENLLRAHATAVAIAVREHTATHAEQAATIALAVEPLLSSRGLSRSRAALLDDALTALDAARSGNAVLRTELLLSRGDARREMGETSLAYDDFVKGLASAETSGRASLVALARMRLGGARDHAGDTRAAREHFVAALELLRDEPPNGMRSLHEAEMFVRLGHAHRREGALPEARAAIRGAIARFRRIGHDEGLASAMYELAVVEMFDGAHDAAIECFDEGVRVAERGDVRVMTGALKTARGSLLQDLGRLDEARSLHAEAARIFRETGSRYREASALYYLATTYLESGDPAEAEAVLSQSRERLWGVGAPRYEALIAGARACALAAMERFDEATEALAEAEVAAAKVRDEPALVGNVRIHRIGLELRRKTSDAAMGVGEAEALVRAHPNDDSRFALRMLRAIARGVHGDPEALVVGAGGRSFTLPGARAPVVLPERSPMRRILLHLARKRIDAPGEGARIEEIIEVAWPGERIVVAAALNRAYVAIANLRKLGLKGALVSAGGGYALSQAVVVRVDP